MTLPLVFGSPAARAIVASQPPTMIPCPWCETTKYLLLRQSTKEYTQGTNEGAITMARHKAHIHCKKCGCDGPPGMIKAIYWEPINPWDLALAGWNKKAAA